MAKVKSTYACTACGYESPRWVGRCPGCGAWNTLEESLQAVPEKTGKVAANQRPGTGAKPMALKDIPEDITLRTSTGISDLNADNRAEVARYSLDGRRLNAPQKGVNIVKFNDGKTQKVVVK